MAIVSIAQIKNWFKNGLKPTQEHFWNWMDSYWHKHEQIPISSVKDLENHLANHKHADLAKRDASNLLPEDVLAWQEALAMSELETFDHGVKLTQNHPHINVTDEQTQAEFNAAVESVLVSVDEQLAEKLEAPSEPGTYIVEVDSEGNMTWKPAGLVYNFKGSVQEYADLLDIVDPQPGDVYNVETPDSLNGVAAGDNLAWTGSEWDNLGGIFDASNLIERWEFTALENRVITTEPQTLSPEQQAQARANIGVTSDGSGATASIWDLDSSLNLSLKDVSGLNNTGNSSILIGSGAGNNNTVWGTIGIGYETVQNQEGNHTIGIGTQSGQNYLGEQGVLIGYQAGQNSAAINLVAIGLEAAKGFSGLNEGSVVAIGKGALSTPTTEGFSLWQGSQIVAIGTDAAKNIASTASDVYIGYQAGRDAGVAATANNQYSHFNVGIGLSALRGVVGVDNIGIGGSWINNGGGTPLGAGRNLKGNGNILLGAYTGHSAVGNGNIIMGDRAQGVINGSRNVIIQGIGTVTGFNHNKNTVINAQWHTGSYIGAFDPHAQSKNELTAIGWNYAIYGNGTTRKLSIYPTASINPAEPRERLDLTDGFMVSAGTKVDQGSYQVTLEANTLTANRSQKYPDADGTFALVEETGKRIVIELEGFTLPAAISAGIQNSFAPIDILTICPSVDLDYIDWEITWKESGVMHKISALDDFSIQLKWSSKDCFQLTGLTKAESGVSINKVNNPKLILRY